MTEGCDLGALGPRPNLLRTALVASGSGMLVNSAETSYAISFCPGGTSRLLTLSRKSPLFWMWRSDLPTRGPQISANTLDAFNVRLPRLAIILFVERRPPCGS